jgi:hypothetical protein
LPKFGRIEVHRGHFFEHVLGLGVLALAVFNFLGLPGFVLRDGIDLDFLGSRVSDEQRTEHGKVQASCCRLLL